MRRVFTLLLSVLFLLQTGCFALEAPEESSGQVSAPTLAVETDVQPTESAPTVTPANTDEPATNTPEVAETPTATVPLPVATATAEPPTATPDTDATATAEAAQESVLVVYTVDAGQSEARFLIDEVLRGEDVTVVGVTSNVAGQVAVDLNNSAATQIGTIVINARDIVTDNNFRNRAISNEILLTDEYELITFVPTSVVGLPDNAAQGESYSFQIIGDLTITDQTREVTFETSVTPISDAEIMGLASAEIMHADFNLTIPFSQAVAAVADTVTLEFEFVALAD